MLRKRTVTIALAIVTAIALHARETVRFMPAWTPQAQFAGFYVALDMGFYDEEDLDVVIEHMGINSSKPGIVRIAEGEIDMIGSHPIQALIARDTGTKVVNTLQVTQNTGIMVVSHKPIVNLQSLEGAKIGRWQSGFSEICELSCKANNLNVIWVPFLNGINLFLSGAVDATVAMSYNEYNLLVEATGGIPEENCIHFSDYGYDIPEDGVYVTEEYYNTHRETVEKFNRATCRGWDYCIEHPDKALDIVMKWTEKTGIRTNRYHQSLMLKSMNGLIVNPRTGKADYSPIPEDKFNRLIQALIDMQYISSPTSYKEFIK